MSETPLKISYQENESPIRFSKREDTDNMESNFVNS